MVNFSGRHKYGIGVDEARRRPTSGLHVNTRNSARFGKCGQNQRSLGAVSQAIAHRHKV